MYDGRSLTGRTQPDHRNDRRRHRLEVSGTFLERLHTSPHRSFMEEWDALLIIDNVDTGGSMHVTRDSGHTCRPTLTTQLEAGVQYHKVYNR